MPDDPPTSRKPLLLTTTIVLLAAALATGVHFSDASRFASWTREDGPIENLQAVLYAVASMFFGAFAFRNRRNPWAWFFAVGLFLCAGEEISWGQRIFGFATPSEMSSVNIQHEANLHNIENIHGNVRTYGFMLLGLIFVAWPIAESGSSWLRRTRQRAGLFRIPAHIVPIAIAAFGFMLIPRYVDAKAFDFDEVGELFTALTLCLYGGATLRPKVRLPRLERPSALDTA